MNAKPGRKAKAKDAVYYWMDADFTRGLLASIGVI